MKILRVTNSLSEVQRLLMLDWTHVETNGCEGEVLEFVLQAPDRSAHTFLPTGTETHDGFTITVGCCSCGRGWPCPVLAELGDVNA